MKIYRIDCDGCPGVGTSSNTSHADARKELRLIHGWRCERYGDYCGECVMFMQRGETTDG